MRSFVHTCLAAPVPDAEVEAAVCWNVVVPVLVAQGRADSVVLPAMAEHVLATCPTAEASWYDGVGHVPHLEDSARFNRELAELTRRTRG
jgi:pimeloyl-ACP methyl ester carboxylesterase